MRYQAHRGVASEAPENTMAAYRLAVLQGYDVIELDPDFTKDGVCVLFHDKTLARTARSAEGDLLPAERTLRETSFAELMKLDVGLSHSPKYRGEKVPTLKEALADAYAATETIEFEGKYMRHDIGQRALAAMEGQ